MKDNWKTVFGQVTGEWPATYEFELLPAQAVQMPC